jgi:hypothetical protein
LSHPGPPKFRNLSESYIIIFTNKLKKLNITPKKEEKIKIKMSVATTMEPVRDSQVPSWLFGPRTDVLAAPTPIGPLSNTGNVLCFNRNVSKLYNNSVV